MSVPSQNEWAAPCVPNGKTVIISPLRGYLKRECKCTLVTQRQADRDVCCVHRGLGGWGGYHELYSCCMMALGLTVGYV